MLEHKAIRIELPTRRDCRVDFLARTGIECRLDYRPHSSAAAALYVADAKGRLVCVFCDENRES